MSTKTKSNQSTVIIVLLALLLIVGGFLAYQMVSKDSDVQDNTQEEQKAQEDSGVFTTIEQDPNVVLAEGGKSLDEQLSELQEKVDKGHVALNMNVTMVVEENGTTGNIYLENPVNNHYDLFVTLFLDETQGKIAQTGVIPRGGAVKTLELSEKLTSGNHPATLTYNLIDENKQVVEQASVGIEIVVK